MNANCQTDHEPTEVGSFLLTHKKSWVTEEQAFHLSHGTNCVMTCNPPSLCDGSLCDYLSSSQSTHENNHHEGEGKGKNELAEDVIQFNDDDNNVALEKNWSDMIPYNSREINTNGLSPLMMMTQGFDLDSKMGDFQSGMPSRPKLKRSSDAVTLPASNSTELSCRFQCDKCHKGFKCKSWLEKHALVHSNLRPYKCMICSRRFKRNYDLTKHGIVHCDR